MFDFLSCFRELGIEYWTEGKNVRLGNVNVCCPFCDDHSNHCGGYPPTGQVFCWRCGAHGLPAFLKALGADVAAMLKKYGTASKAKLKAESKPTAGQCLLPETEKELNPRAEAYLESRGFDPVWLQQVYAIRSTGPAGRYKFRVVIPVQYKGECVSFVARDYTGQAELRYLTADRSQEKIHHKDILYNLDSTDGMDAVLVVEGITDAWRIGAGAVATFGTAVTPAQVRVLAGLKKVVYILFDNEPTAQDHARELAGALALLGVHTEILTLPEGVADPGELEEHAVKKLRAAVWG